jgi:hypothetical protein
MNLEVARTALTVSFLTVKCLVSPRVRIIVFVMTATLELIPATF